MQLVKNETDFKMEEISKMEENVNKYFNIKEMSQINISRNISKWMKFHSEIVKEIFQDGGNVTEKYSKMEESSI